MASGGVEGDSDEFTECGWCGISTGGEEHGGIDLGSSFVKFSGRGKTKANALESAGTAINLRKCSRCKSIAYCSQSCQRLDYPNHKDICRKIGENRGGNIVHQRVQDEACVQKADWREPGPPDVQKRRYQPSPKKGVPAPSSHPRTSITEPFEPAMTANNHLVLHCDYASRPACHVAGVYTSFNPNWYVYDPEMTYKVGSMGLAALEVRDYCFDFPAQECDLALFASPDRTTFDIYVKNTGERLIEINTPRSRGSLYWNDPNSLLYMNPLDIYSRWEWQSNQAVLKIAITPLETLIQAAAAIAIDAPIPLKYMQPPDFSAWNQSFILHVDPRTCHAPLHWIDNLTGVYEPVHGQLLNGYPVWKRECSLTTLLVNKIAGPAKNYLASMGIRIGHPGNMQRLLYVRKDDDWLPSLLSLTTALDPSVIARDIARNESALEATYVPSCIAELLTESASLFTMPDKAFSSWTMRYEGQLMEIHVALTPYFFFEEAVSLATLAALDENERDSSTKAASKKKRSKKKGKRCAASNANKSIPQVLSDSSLKAHTSRPGRVLERQSVVMDSTTSEAKSDNPEGNDPSIASNNNKKNHKKKKNRRVNDESKEKCEHAHRSDDEVFKIDEMTQVTSDIVTEPQEAEAHTVTCKGIPKSPNQRFDAASCILEHLASLVKADSSCIPCTSNEAFDLSGIESWSVFKTLQILFEGQTPPFWLHFDDSITSPILLAAASTDTCDWITTNASQLVILFSERGRRNDLTALLQAGVGISGMALTKLLSTLPRGRGDQFNNKIVKILCAHCQITMDSGDEFGRAISAASHVIGKSTKRELVEALKKASAQLKQTKKQQNREKKVDLSSPVSPPIEKHACNNEDKVDDMTNKAPIRLLGANGKIQDALKWYNELLDELVMKAADIKDESLLRTEDDLELSSADATAKNEPKPIKKPRVVLTSEQVAAALSNCDSEDALANVETGVDLFQWDSHSAWTIDITEQAHKFFQKHIKKDKALCERIIRRLTLLATGRWPYVLCKSLKSKSIGKYGKKINLYETKIDSASRIIWEVAIAFSPRRSSLDQSYCEQVIRVWSIVLDHDNLARAIDQTIDRIEQSHLRGEDCAICAELIKSQNRPRPSQDTIGVTRIPRVFPMSNEMSCSGPSAIDQTAKERTRHFHPASDDPRQFTLLKFYELNASAVKILFDGNDDNSDLPFTPGPKEHAIIHHQSDPKRSILLMGRSGTGKTTCLVFRMWAQYASHLDGHTAQLRQLFLTKNDVLCCEVERSFNNMGLAWRKRCGTASNKNAYRGEVGSVTGLVNSKLTKFMTSSEWLEALDILLPGQKFFSPQEIEQRSDERKLKDTVTRGVEALLCEEQRNIELKDGFLRQELTFPVFRKFWRKISSGSCLNMDCTIVWREIKSFIKGSVPALHIGKEERSQNRFLSLDEYLALPRKQSRMDQTQRQEVYALFVKYEKVKQGGYYDECDLVYNIAGRISLLDVSYFDHMDQDSVLPVDSLFVDECQDWTQAELYVLAKLCSDPNALFLAGDTAQSIAVGIDFRFTDVRQTFYNHFGGLEPELLQLSHNYRSHAGVLRLAACVVELIYFFFSTSLDKLPPDLGLFDGPKPVIMKVASTADLILMLDGAKRETSRIEFGAHQVVIVRSEEAKKKLPDEFGVDRDWVMTVQESKGLEFDDVLLYNFFTDSLAGDAWRVVSNYTKEDIDNYYRDIPVASSGVQKYNWEESFLGKTRHLDFSMDQHKILETELKMLYTAITRARVNVFIAETDTEACKPMFNYFQRRAVVDIVDKDKPNSEGLSSVRVFGGMSTVDDWRSRGEYYLQNAEGERQKGCLRLAAKCFDKSGEVKRRDFALALLAFVEIEEQINSKKRGKQSVEWNEKLYSITGQLLDARDVVFLNKAALCLLWTGEHQGDAARMFELYGRICYAQRVLDSTFTSSPLSQHVQKNFTYAGKLFEKCILRSDKSVKAMDSLRCYLCGGMYDDAARLISSGALPLQDGNTFTLLSKLFLESQELERDPDPIASFHRDFQQSEECTIRLRDAISKAARVGCRMLAKHGDTGFSAALKLLPSRSDRIELLYSIDTNADLVLSKKPWSSHPTFAQNTKRDSKSSTDSTDLLISDLKLEGRYEEIIGLLEDRGFLQEAADELDQLLSTKKDTNGLSSEKCHALRTKFVELMLLSSEWRANKQFLISILDLNRFAADNNADVDTRFNSLLSRALLTDNPHKLVSVVTECKDSILWQQRALELAFEKTPKERLLDMLPGASVSERFAFVYGLANKLACLASALRKPSTSLEDKLLVINAERFFELTPKKMDPDVLETKPVVNSRLREVLNSEKCTLPFSSGEDAQGFNQSIRKETLHPILARFISSKAGLVLMKLNELAGAYEQKKRCRKHFFSIADLCEYVQCLQVHLLCKREMTDSCNSEGKRGSSPTEPWKSIRKYTDMAPVASELLSILFNEKRVTFAIEKCDLSQLFGTQASSADVIVVMQSVIDIIADDFSKLPIERQKQNIMHTIESFKLRSLHKNREFACKELHRDIVNLEKHQKSKRRGYYINKKNQCFPRLWLWVVESSDVKNSISVVERIIDTSLKDGFTSLSKLDQISLLEVNAVALFGALCLRYSEGAEPAPIILPKRSYLQGLVTGETGFVLLQVLGHPLKDVLLSYCHKQFDRVFQHVVVHLEKTAAIVLGSKLLSSRKGDGDETFEKAFTLSTFLCCNAVIFSTTGKDMDKQDYERDLSVLPSLPLQGNVMKLVAELKRAHEKFSPMLPITFLDLLESSDKLLKSSFIQDHFVLCRLKQRTEHDVDVHIVDDISQIRSRLGNIPFVPNCGTFTSHTKSMAFLSDVDLGYDEGEHGQKSEELNAVRLIVRLFKAKAARERTRSEVDAAIMFFRRWKLTMRIFIMLLKRWTAKRTSESRKVAAQYQESNSGVDKTGKCILTQMFNPFIDQSFHQRREKFKHMFCNSVVDCVECTFCCILFQPDAQIKRYGQWVYHGQTLSFPLFAQHYNKNNFGEENPCFSWLTNHVQSPLHQDNTIFYQKRLDDVATVMARIEMGSQLLVQIVSSCDERGRSGHVDSWWYLNTAEECRALISRLQKVQADLHNAGMIWSVQSSHAWTQNLMSILHDASQLPQLAESFFANKMSEEVAMHDIRMEGSNPVAADANMMSDNPIDELMRGPYLMNPEAQAFIPRYG